MAKKKSQEFFISTLEDMVELVNHNTAVFSKDILKLRRTQKCFAWELFVFYGAVVWATYKLESRINDISGKVRALEEKASEQEPCEGA